MCFSFITMLAFFLVPLPTLCCSLLLFCLFSPCTHLVKMGRKLIQVWPCLRVFLRVQVCYPPPPRPLQHDKETDSNNTYCIRGNFLQWKSSYFSFQNFLYESSFRTFRITKLENKKKKISNGLQRPPKNFGPEFRVIYFFFSSIKQSLRIF